MKKGQNMSSLKGLVVAALILIMVMACSGKMDGVVRRDAKRIDIMYSDSRLKTAELATVLPNGERFNGKSEPYDRNQEVMSADSSTTDDAAVHFEDLQTFAGNVKATLTSDRGNVIECRFKLTDVVIGFSSGGVGICQVSDGRVIDVFF
jgi:hypothetical protein